MGNCFSSEAVPLPFPLTERRPTENATVKAEGESSAEGNQNQVSLTSALREPRGEDSIICAECDQPCGFTNGRYYFKCLQCPSDFNICKRCYAQGCYHSDHAYAFVDNEVRHRFMERFYHHMGGWPILSQVPSAEPIKSPHPLKCKNETVGDLLPKRCPNPVSWICLQCPSSFTLCDSCMWLPFQHTRHVFATASTENLKDFIASLQNSGVLPLSSSFIDDAYGNPMLHNVRSSGFSAMNHPR